MLVPESRLLMESDAPYFPLRGNKWSAPNQIYEAAARVAECRQVPVESILSQTADNAKSLYRLGE
ncbi:hypothetical protein DPMN_008392 [Dreissena polymorpha]|uniref:Uncharacterized protein n=1 Tax=Dreissena polymorpha TaxID=45954 RepID=A0A9D4RXA3_DREPO|nr:hypothetical protein DPMN_008392 [Dreissena polymorpha]